MRGKFDQLALMPIKKETASLLVQGTKPTAKKEVKVAAKQAMTNSAKKAATKALPKATKKTAIKDPTARVKRIQEFEVLPTAIPAEARMPHVISPRQDAMLTVSFDDAMQVRPLLGELGKQAEFSLIHHLVSHGGDMMATALSGATVVMEDGAVLVRFTKEGAKLFKAKELKLMGNSATLVSKSGKIVENARVMGPLTKSTRIAANLTVAAVTVAHIVSGADLAKKLNKLDLKVDFLVAAHRNDQLARIEGVYRQAKEILHMEQNVQTRGELHRLGLELFEVRSALHREIGHHVGNLHKSEESLNLVVGFFQGFSRKGKDQKVAQTVTARDVEIQLISGSIAIHIALAQAAGMLDIFLQVSLPDDLAELNRLRMVLSERRDYIHEKHPELRDSVSEACAQLDDVIRIYDSMVVPRQALGVNIPLSI